MITEARRLKNIYKTEAAIDLDRKEYDDALSLADSYLQVDSTNMDIRGIKGVAYYLKGDFKKSEDIFQRMEDEGNDGYNVHFYLGLQLYIVV